MVNPLSPLDLLARSAFVYRDKIAIVEGDRRFTYAEFNTRVHKLASALRKAGVQKGDRVAVLAPNSSMALEPHFAVPLIGAVLVMLNTRLQEQELTWIMNHCGAKVLLRDPQLCLPFDGLAVSDYEAFLETGDAPLINVPTPDENDMICINAPNPKLAAKVSPRWIMTVGIHPERPKMQNRLRKAVAQIAIVVRR